MESPDRRKLSLFWWFIPLWQWAVHSGTPGNEACLGRAQQGEAAASRALGTGTAAVQGTRPLFRTLSSATGEASSLLGFCLEERVLNALSMPHHVALAGFDAFQSG